MSLREKPGSGWKTVGNYTFYKIASQTTEYQQTRESYSIRIIERFWKAMSDELDTDIAKGQLQVRIAEPDGSSEVHFKISGKRPLERMFLIWTQKRNEAKATNCSFEFLYNGNLLSPTDIAEKCNFTKGALITAVKSAQIDPETPHPHRWPFKHETDFSVMQDLVRTSPSKYISPLMPFPLFDPANVFPATFGPDMQQANFLIQPNLTYLNHGSYGATPQVVLNAQQKWQHFMETNCCRFFGFQYSAFMAHAIRTMASFIGAQPEEVVFVDNATTGVVTVIQSLKLKPSDSLLYTSLGYGPIENYIKTLDVEKVLVDIPMPIEVSKIAEKVLSAVKPNTRLVILDHITSATGFIIPIENMIDKLRARGVFVLIDGAHAVGQIPLNMGALGADAYVSNCHKWLYSSKGCAFLWVHPKHEKTIHPLVVSCGAGVGLTAEFGWSGTKDYTPYLSVMTAIELYNFWGTDKLRTYNHNWAVEAADHLINVWGARTVFADDSENPNSWKRHVGAMVTLELPSVSGESFIDLNFALQAKRIMLLEKGIDCCIYPIGDKLYTRISGQIYLDKEDYITFGEDLPRVLDSLVLHYKASQAGFSPSTQSFNTSPPGPDESH